MLAALLLIGLADCPRAAVDGGEFAGADAAETGAVATANVATDTGTTDALDGCSGGCDDGDPCTTDACAATSSPATTTSRASSATAIRSIRTRLPIVVSGAKDLLRVCAGGETTCAIRPAGVLWCWCDNEYGELGNRSTKPSFTWVEVTLP